MNLSVSSDGTGSLKCCSARGRPCAGHMSCPLKREDSLSPLLVPQHANLPAFHRSLSGVRRMIRGFAEWKHLALLVALVVAGILEPLSVSWPESARIIAGTVVFVVNVPVFLVIFEERRERGLALCLLAPLF